VSETIELDREVAIAMVYDALDGIGISDQDRDVISRHLVDAEHRGYSSHGLIRVSRIIAEMQGHSSAKSRRLKVDRGSFIFLDGGSTQGIAAVTELLEIAALRVFSQGAIVAAASDFIGTTGCLGVYGQRLAEQNLVSLQFCHSEALVAPFGAIDPVMGTNPIAISIPCGGHPFVADLATSARSFGSIRVAKEREAEIPFGVVQDKDGNPSNNPDDAVRGSMLPMAGYKGYALGLAIETICGPVFGGKAGRTAAPGSDSYFSVIFRADNVRPLREVQESCGKLFDEVRFARVKNGQPNARIPGERRLQSADKISISRELYAELTR
jgi:L-2-hydroxycarboxylate dehydrogenase (NAD+)